MILIASVDLRFKLVGKRNCSIGAKARPLVTPAAGCLMLGHKSGGAEQLPPNVASSARAVARQPPAKLLSESAAIARCHGGFVEFF